MDGDTIRGRIGKHRERVRDIGVHAPEIPHAGYLPARIWATFRLFVSL